MPKSAKENKQEPKKEQSLGITVKKEEDMPEWYSQVILKAEVAEHAPIKGCMIIRPLGYALWESIQNYFNERLKELNVKNAYFPLFIPESFFEKEKEHAKGFTPEVAWIANLDDDTKERLAIRPTSETIMYHSYSKWVRSWRDLPLRINQWCNIVRWEVKDVKLFLRSREFLWQEGHCVYETLEECDKETLMILDEYTKLCENLLALPVLTGKKSESEKFAGAHYTTTIEAFMPDGKALQMGTSHNLGQGFAKAFEISYLGKDSQSHLPWQNSWGVSTRLIGGMIMLHSDDKGLVLPPKIAPLHIVIVPIFFEKGKEDIIKKCRELSSKIKGCIVHVDDRDECTPGWKFNEWELKGVPLRIELGPRDLEKEQCVFVRRDNSKKEFVKLSEANKKAKETLDDIQSSLFNKAKKLLDESIVNAKNWDEFLNAVNNKKIAYSPHCGDAECEQKIKEATKGVTNRCIPLEQKEPKEKCVNCSKKAKHYAYFARNY